MVVLTKKGIVKGLQQCKSNEEFEWHVLQANSGYGSNIPDEVSAKFNYAVQK